MGGLFLRLRTWWETADRTQKVVTIFGGSFLLLLLAGTFYFGSRPKMAMAWGGLTPADQGRVVAEIQKLGIPVEYDLRGGVLVPSDRVAEVQSALSRNGMAPTSGHAGNGELRDMGPMTTKNVEEARLKAIREGEIAKSIETIGGVASAQVLLSGGERGPFADEEDHASASVVVTERPGASLGGDEAKAIASLVSRAVPGLKTKDVTIVNQSGSTLFDGAIEEGQAGKYTAKLEAQINEARRIKRELQRIFDDAFGANNTIVTARVEMDFDVSREESTTPIVSDELVSKDVAKETYGDSSKAPVLRPSGTAANTPDLGAPSATDGAAPGGKGYGLEQKSEKRAEGQMTVKKDKAPGTINAMAISVLVDSKAVKDPKPVEDLLNGYLGPKKNDPNYSATVTSTEFDRTDDKKATEAVTATASRERIQQLITLLPVGALILVAIVVIKALGKAAKNDNVLVQALPDGRLITVGGKPGSLATINAQYRSGGVSDVRSNVLEHVEEEEEEDTYEEIEDDTGAKTWKPKKRKKGPRVEDIEDIPDQINVPLEQIKKMGHERPTVAAMLIKSWLITD